MSRPNRSDRVSANERCKEDAIYPEAAGTANGRVPTQWNMREKLTSEKVAVHNRRKNSKEKFKMLDVSSYLERHLLITNAADGRGQAGGWGS